MQNDTYYKGSQLQQSLVRCVSTTPASGNALTGRRDGRQSGQSGSRLEPDAVDDVVAVSVIAGGTAAAIPVAGSKSA